MQRVPGPGRPASAPGGGPLGSERRKRVVELIVAAVLSIGLLVAGIAAVRGAYALFTCPTPTQGELETQATFVKAHLADVSDVELDTVDCDGGGSSGTGFVDFTTALAPSAARDAFLANNPARRPAMTSWGRRSDVPIREVGDLGVLPNRG